MSCKFSQKADLYRPVRSCSINFGKWRQQNWHEKSQNTFFIDICWSQRGGSAMCNLSFLMNHLLDSWPSSLSKSFLKAPTANFANNSWHGPVHYRLSGKVVQENMGLPGTGKPGQWLRDICGREAPMYSFPKEDFLQFLLSMFSVCIWTC